MDQGAESLYGVEIMKMRKAHINFIVDAIGFLAMALLASTGFVVKYALPSGSGHSRTLWGMTRHEWGGVHFWLAVVLLAMMLLHLLLHWHWVLNMIKGPSPETARPRMIAALVLLLVVAGLVAAPFLTPIASNAQRTERKGTESEEHGRNRGESEEHGRNQVRGFMTLNEVAATAGVEADTLLRELDLPADFPVDERLGPLQNEYPFDLQTLRQVVEDESGQD